MTAWVSGGINRPTDQAFSLEGSVYAAECGSQSEWCISQLIGVLPSGFSMIGVLSSGFSMKDRMVQAVLTDALASGNLSVGGTVVAARYKHTCGGFPTTCSQLCRSLAHCATLSRCQSVNMQFCLVLHLVISVVSSTQVHHSPRWHLSWLRIYCCHCHRSEFIFEAAVV